MRESSIKITRVSSEQDILGILALQRQNLRQNLTTEQIKSQGFVTVSHTYEALAAMNEAEPSVIAKDGDAIVGYCLAMLPQFSMKVPELAILFDTIGKIEYEGKRLGETKYCVMGQVCVAQNYRGLGVFELMNLHLREALHDNYDFCITDISSQNSRSMRAHQKIGYQPIMTFYDKQLGEDWVVVIWDWREYTSKK